MKRIKLTGLVLWLFSFSVLASTEAEYIEFFDKYQALGKNFDVAVTELYSDDAKIVVTSNMLDGIEQTMKIGGKQWKQMAADAMEIGKQRGDVSEFK